MKQIENIHIKDKNKLIRQDSKTSRTMGINNKQPVILNKMMKQENKININKFNTVQKDYQINKQFRQTSLQKKIFKRSSQKTKKNNDFLLVKNGINMKLLKPLTADSQNLQTINNKISSYQVKKYKTVIDFGLLPEKNINNNNVNVDNPQQISPQRIKNNHKLQKHQSFMLSKYSGPSTSSILNNNNQGLQSKNLINHNSNVNKSYSHNKLKNLKSINLDPQILIKTKCQSGNIKSKLKKCDILLQNNINNNIINNNNNNFNNDKRLKSQTALQNMNQKNKLNISQNMCEHINNQNNNIQTNKNHENHQKDTLNSLQPTQQIQSILQYKGFKGKKIKSNNIDTLNSIHKSYKNKYFIPDFIMPSLQLTPIDKKEFDEFYSRQKSNKNQKHDDGNKNNQEQIQTKQYQTKQLFKIDGQNYVIALEGHQLQLNSKQFLVCNVNTQKQVQNNNKSQKIQQTIQTSNIQPKVYSRYRQQYKNKKQHQQTQLCGWNQQKNMKKNKKYIQDQVLLNDF